jgi:hypothetical protein
VRKNQNGKRFWPCRLDFAKGAFHLGFRKSADDWGLVADWQRQFEQVLETGEVQARRLTPECPAKFAGALSFVFPENETLSGRFKPWDGLLAENVQEGWRKAILSQ